MSHREIDEIADGVWLGRPAHREGAMGAVRRRRPDAVIDSTSYPPFAARFVEAVAADAPARSRAALHHAPPLRPLRRSGGIDAPIMSHRLTRDALASYDDAWLDRHVPTWIEQGMMDPELVGEPKVVIPQITFEGDATIDVGGRDGRLLRHVGGHCADQCIAYVPVAQAPVGQRQRVQRPRNRPSTMPTCRPGSTRWSALSELDIEIVVPGHGDIGGPELLVEPDRAAAPRSNLEQMGAGA